MDVYVVIHSTFFNERMAIIQEDEYRTRAVGECWNRTTE
jgi:hypothetical protein